MNRRGNSREFLRIGSLCAGLSLPWDRHGAEQERLEKRFDQAVFGYVPRLRRETRYKIGIKFNGTPLPSRDKSFIIDYHFADWRKNL